MKPNTHFILANINRTKTKAVWWLDIPLSKVTSQDYSKFDLLLFDYRNHKLHHLSVPVSFFKENISRLVVRNNKIRLELSADSAQLLRDVRPKSGGINFRSFKHCSRCLRR